jgi:hypothetical protein
MFFVDFDSKTFSTPMDFPEALEDVFAIYYLPTLEYPFQISLSMEFIQRTILSLYSDIMRGNKKSIDGLAKFCPSSVTTNAYKK